MTLYHVTSRSNQGSIDRDGLLPEKATHGEKAVWLVSRSNIGWALAHTAAKPGRGGVNDLVVYTVRVGRSRLNRKWRGIWRSYATIRPVCVQPSSDFTDRYPS